MTVKQISNIIVNKQSVRVWSVSDRKALYEGANELMPLALNDLNVRFISSDLANDFTNNTYSVVTTIFVD